MISLLTAFFLYTAEASWGWWVGFTILASWQIVLAFLALVITVNKK